MRGKISITSATMLLKEVFIVPVVLMMLAIAASQVASSSPEHDAYTAAMHRKDVQAKANALESFLTKYPNSGLREGALESLVQAYQQTLSPKQWNALHELLTMNPN